MSEKGAADSDKQIRVTVHLDPEWNRQLDAIAKSQRRPIANIGGIMIAAQLGFPVDHLLGKAFTDDE